MKTMEPIEIDDVCIIEPQSSVTNSGMEETILVPVSLIIESEVLLIQEAGTKLGCLNTTICHAMLIYHHFRSLRGVQRFDKISLIAAVLALSIKKSEEDIDTKDIIHIVYNLKMGKSSKVSSEENLSEESVKSMLLSLKKIQHFLCENFKYELEPETAHSYVFKYLLQFKSMPEVPDHMVCAMSSFAMKVMGTFYMSERCIKYRADEIALACIQFTLVYSNFDKVGLRYFKKELSEKNLKKERLQDILDDLIVVCDVSTAIE